MPDIINLDKRVHTQQVIWFDSAEAYEEHVQLRIKIEVDRKVKEKLLSGWITGQEAIQQGYFPFKLRTLKAKINNGDIEGTIKGDKEVYVNINTLEKYIKEV